MRAFKGPKKACLNKNVFDRLGRILDFRGLERSLVEALPSGSWSGEGDFRPFTLVKIAFLRRWYGLTEERVLEEIRDRRSLERFVGEGVWNPRLDAEALRKFEDELRKAGVLDAILKRVDDEIDRAGYRLTRGYALDPCLVGPGGVRAKWGTGPAEP